MDKRSKIIGITVIFITLIIFMSVKLIIYINKGEVEPPAMMEPVDEIITIDNDDKGITQGNDEGRDMSIVEAKAIEVQARRLIAKFEFFEANNLVAEKINEYNLENSEGFEYLKDMYYDLPIMSQFDEMMSFGYITEIRDAIKDLADMENFFIASMWLDVDERNYIIEDMDGLNPSFYEGVSVKSKEAVMTDNDIYKEALRMHPNTESMTEILFSIEGFDLKAYIGIEGERYYFFTMKKVNEDAPYYTKTEWEEVWKDINENLKKDN